MTPFITLTSHCLPLLINNIDTDQILPARFLKVTDKTGLGKWAFADWRYDASGGNRPDFMLNAPIAEGAKILLAGDNFGCGSSREHAPWALVDLGIRAIISTSFADIFRNNALKNGLLTVVVTEDAHAAIAAAVAADPTVELTIDLEAQCVVLPNGQAFSFPIAPFSKNCLLRGVDELGYLLGFSESIAAYEQRAAK